MTTNFKGDGARTFDLFLKLVPNAKKIKGSGQFELVVDNTTCTIRVKCGKGPINQNHLYHGEPLVVHVPSDDDSRSGRWYVLDIEWLIRYAIKHPDSNQHTSHALECFMFNSNELSLTDSVDPDTLASACENAIRDSRAHEIQDAVKLVREAREAARLQFVNFQLKILEALNKKLVV